MLTLCGSLRVHRRGSAWSSCRCVRDARRLAESLHEDLAPFGVKVTLVYPGYFRTSFLRKESLALPSRPLAVYEVARASEERHLAYPLEAPPLHLFAGSVAVRSLVSPRHDATAAA